jgi:alpha-beta hydrolase superfamily lysophospholipase
MGAALEKDSYGCKVDGVIASGGLLSVGAQFLPPAPVVKILVFLARYYPRLGMPATDFESTFDDAFGDKDWAKTARQDPKISTQLKPTIGAVAATLSTGELIRAKANEFPVKFYAVHGERDVRTPCEAMQEFVDQLGPEKASMDIIDTAGHQLLQDQPEITNEVMTKTKAWILKTIKDMK